MQAVYNFFVGIVNKLLYALTLVLPISPFQRYIRAMENLPYLGIVNYFVPIGTIISIFFAWLMALASFYFYSIVLRWIKAVGD